jgi:hypothetical protein
MAAFRPFTLELRQVLVLHVATKMVERPCELRRLAADHDGTALIVANRLGR